ncbi:alpha/beta hydrolase [Methylocaldum sp.]|uniref:alpha/beta fold hydrolase n=1 Tax=Methylocaldum sp. TaxID=1969727 RepID=UPI002D5B1955|nr:alpha/beta hydrolase [Methylocaldum sp.]HYE37259.1 alpha/beta hydrolase [Methylocaldum sp.]
MEHQFIVTNGIRLHVVQAGPESGPLLIFLHGFPEFWYGWRHQISYFASAGYRVWVPDQRGYNRSDKPEGVGTYRLEQIAADAVGLIDAANRRTAFLVGHDWGAAVAWWIAEHHPERLERMAILNGPHGAVFQRHLLHSPTQWLRSAYLLFLQIPKLPEVISRLRQWRLPTKALQRSSRPGTFTAEDLDWYRQAWSQPGAYTAMVNWYRAMLRWPPKYPANPRIKVPTLLLWGVQDRFLEREMAQPSIDLCDDGRLIFVEAATHWVQHEEAQRVNVWIDAFLRGAAVGVQLEKAAQRNHALKGFGN